MEIIIQVVIPVLTLVFSGIAAWEVMARSLRRWLIRKRLNKYFPEFKKELVNETIYQDVRVPDAFGEAEESIDQYIQGRKMAKIREGFIKKLGPKNEMEEEVFTEAVKSYMQSKWKQMSWEETRAFELSKARPSPAQKQEMLEGYQEEEENLKSKLYENILYRKREGK